jgi:hypothetical protein
MLVIETLEIQKKRDNIQRYNNPSLLKGFKRFFIDDSCRLSLEAGHLNNLWFAIIQA